LGDAGRSPYEHLSAGRREPTSRENVLLIVKPDTVVGWRRISLVLALALATTSRATPNQ
jgi:hypothetical protein